MALVPLYRLQGNGDHFYTLSPEERDSAIASYGYAYEGVACYVENAPPLEGDHSPDEAWNRCYLVALAAIANENASSDAIASHAAAIADSAMRHYKRPNGGP